MAAPQRHLPVATRTAPDSVPSLRRRAWLLALAATAALPAGLAAGANPIQVSHVAAGAATFSQAGGTTTITAANNTIINYVRFNIPQGNTVDFVQPSATARVLNRIIGPAPTEIDGNLNANGIVYFVNPAGVMFGAGAVINVGQLYAAAGHLSDAHFLAGDNVFTDSHGSLTNAGIIQAGDVTFAAQTISNAGTIVAPHGMVVMAAGTNVYVSKLGSPFVVKVAGGDGNSTGVNNSGAVSARDGDVTIRAGDMYSLAIDTAGSITAGHVSIKAVGAHSTVLVSGKIDAANQGADSTGGSIRINGGKIGVGVTADAAGGYHSAQAILNASGPDGGGKILIGVRPDAASATGYSDASQYDFIGSNVVLNASATATGNGGLVDTSGRVLQINSGATVRVGGAGAGVGGMWLLDPANLTITHSAASGTITGAGTNLETFQPGTTVATGTVSDGNINAGLAAGDNVLVETTNSGASGGNAGNITVNGTVNINPVLTGNVTLTLQADNAIDLTSGAVILPTNSGTNTFVLNVALNADHGGGTTPNITLDGNITTLGGTFAATTGGSGSISIGAGGTAINSGAGSLTCTGPVTLTTPTTLLAGTTAATGVSFSSSVDGGAALVVGSLADATDATLGGNVGTATPLASLEVFGATSLAANVTTTGNQTYTGAVNLTAAVALASTGGTGNISLNSTVDGGHALTVEAATATFSGNVGTGTSLASLSVGGYSTSGPTPAGSATLDGNVTTSGIQTYNGGITLGAAVTLIGSAVKLPAGVTGAANNLTVTGAGTFGTVSGVGALLDTGNATFNNNITSTTSVDVTGTTALNAASITTTGAQTYSGNLTLATATTLTGSTIDLSGGVTGAANNLTVVGAGTFGQVGGVGAFTDTGNAIFSSPVSTTTSINVTGTTLINTATITTSGTQIYSGALTLGAASTLTGSAVKLPGGVTGATNNLTVVGAGTFGTVAGVGALVDTGSAAFNGIISSTNSIDVSGAAAINISSITTPGNQTFSGAVTLGNSVTLAITGAGGIITFGSTISGAQSLVAEANSVLFQGNVGSGTGLTALTSLSTGGYSAGGPTNAGTTTLTGNVTTTGGQTYANSLLISAGAFTLSDSSPAGIVTQSITGTGSPMLNMTELGTGPVTINGAVSGIGTLNVTAGGTVKLGGNISAGSLAISTSTTGTPIALLAPVAIDANVQSYSVSGAGVALNFPALLLSGLHVANLAGTASPTSLSLTQEGSITDSDLPALTAFPGSSVAGMNYTLDSLAGNITLGILATAPVTGANLTLLAPTGSITIGSFGLPIIGALTATTVSTGAITLNNNVTTSGNQTYGGPVTLGNSVTLASTGAGGIITFGSTISGGQGLVAEANSVLFQGNVGTGAGLTPLASLAVGGYSIIGPTAAGTTTLGGNVTTAGNQAWDNPLTLSANATLASTGSSGTITFGSTISGGDALVVEAANSLFDNNVGSGPQTPLTSLAVGGYSSSGPTSAGTVLVGTTSSGGTFTTTGNQSFNAMTLNTNALFSATGGGSLAFTTVTGGGTNFTATATGIGSISVTGALSVSGGAGSPASVSGGNGGAGGSGGTVQLTAINGTINAQTITSTGGGGGVGGTGSISLITGGTGGNGGAGGAGGDGGAVTITSAGNVSAGSISTIGGPGGDGGAGGIDPVGSPGLPGPGGNGGTAGIVTLSSTGGMLSVGNATALGAAPGVGLVPGTIGSSAAISLSGNTGLTLNSGSGNPIALNGGAIRLLGPATLDGDTTITGTTLNGGTAGFSVSSGNVHNLTLQLTGAVSLGSLAGLNTLDAANSGPFMLGGNISTVGGQTFHGPVTLTAPVTLTSSSAGAVLFSGTSATIDGNQPLTINTTGIGGTLGTVTFGGALGGGTPLASLDVTGNVSLGGNVTTVGAQTFNNGVILNDGGLPVTFTFLAGNNTVSFQGTLDGQTSGDSAVVIGSAGQPTGALLGGNVGGTEVLSNLIVNGGVSIGANVTTFGNQTYLGNALLTGTSDTLLANFIAPALIKFGGTVDGPSALSIGDSGTFLISNAEFDGNLGGHTPLTSLLVTGTTTLNGNVTTAGTQAFNGAFTLTNSALLASTGTGSAGNISFLSTVDGSGGLPALNVNTAGATSFGGVVGGPVPTSADISTVDVQNGPAALAGNVSTTAGQTYARGASVSANLTLTGTTLNAAPAGAAAFVGTGTQDLTLNFSTSLNLDLVNSSLLGNLILDNPNGALTIPHSVAINYPLTVAGPVTLGRNTDPAGTVLNLDGPLFWFQNTLTDGGNGNDNLVIGPATGGSSGGNLRLQGVVGGTGATDFASLSVAGTTTLTNNATAITTVGSQVYHGPMIINNGSVNTTLSSSAAGIEEDGGINDASGGITLQPVQALVAPTSILGGADKGDFRPQAYLTLNGGISAPLGTVSLAFLQPTYQGATTFTTGGGTVIGVVPDAATIVTTNPGGISVQGRIVEMGPYQKWTSLGSLSLTGGTNAFLGDMNVAGTLSVSSASIQMWLRPAGSLLVAGTGGTGALGLHTDTAGQEGVDIVANSIIMSSTPTGNSLYSNGLLPQFAIGSGGSSGVGSVHVFGVPISASILSTTNTTSSTPTTYYLDLQATGPATSNVFFTVSPIIPPPAPQINTIVVLSQSERTILREAGINARNTPLDDMLDLYGGHAVFNDIPSSDGVVIIHPTLLDYYVTTSRLPYQQTKDFIALYRTIFLQPKIDSKTHRPVLDKAGNPVYQSRRTALHLLFRNSYAAYVKAVGPTHATALGYRTWLTHTPSQAEALKRINQLHRLLLQARRLGLTAVELRLSTSTILAELNPEALSERQFEEAVTGRRLSHL